MNAPLGSPAIEFGFPKARSKEHSGGRLREAAIALAAILPAVVLMLVWVRVVPIFESPDEQTHFDYAIAIAHAHGLISTKDSRIFPLADPDAAYLADKVGLNSIAFHNWEHVATSYGTSYYFAKINASAPAVKPSYYRAPSHPFPLVGTVYGFGFYGLIAMVAAAAQGPDGLVGAFFASRYTCVILVVVGLFLSFFTLRELHYSTRRAALVTATMGLFPLTVFVGSYVQADNLTFALSCAIFFTALRCRSSSRPMAWIAAVGLLAGIMAVTKIQFYVVLLPVILGGLIPKVKAQPKNLRLAGISLLAVPSLIALTVQYGWVSPMGSNLHRVTFGSMTTAGMVGAYQTGGVLAAAQTLAHWIGMAASDFYGPDGQTFVSFWGKFGWLDTPLIIGNVQIEYTIRTILSALSLLTAVGAAVVIMRYAMSCLAVAVRGRLLAALRLLFADTVTIAYVLFSVMMFVLFAISENGFGGQGRNWFPFLLPFTLIATDIAPRALPVQFRRLATRVSLGLLLCYSLVGSAYALIDVHYRYYGPSAKTNVAVVQHLRAAK